MMRSGELLNLEWKRVNLVDRTVELRVEDTKGKQRRLVALNHVAYEALLRLRRVADANFPETPWVFTHTDRDLLVNALSQYVRFGKLLC